jgi:SAM-dependent methyltransferase
VTAVPAGDVMSLSQIDFARLYRERMRRKKRRERTSEYWDARAPAMSKRAFTSAYVRQFVERMDLTGCATLLDVGCGPGTISLAVAARLERVYGLDYSPGMLAAFARNARKRGLTGVTPTLRAWDDDWSDVPICDLAVASRSTAVPDLEAALLKLDSKARRRVYVTYPADGGCAGDAVCQAIGRPGQALPDYLCVVGILHHLGLHPTLAYLPGKNRLAGCSDFAGFHAKVVESLGDLTAREVKRLRHYFDTHRDRMAREPTWWAMFSWEARARAGRR